MIAEPNESRPNSRQPDDAQRQLKAIFWTECALGGMQGLACLILFFTGLDGWLAGRGIGMIEVAVLLSAFCAWTWPRSSRWAVRHMVFGAHSIDEEWARLGGNTQD